VVTMIPASIVAGRSPSDARASTRTWVVRSGAARSLKTYGFWGWLHAAARGTRTPRNMVEYRRETLILGPWRARLMPVMGWVVKPAAPVPSRGGSGLSPPRSGETPEAQPKRPVM